MLLFGIAMVVSCTESLRLCGIEQFARGGAVVSRLWLLVIAVIAGGAIAFGATFTVTSVLSSSNESPVNQQLFNYGQR